MKLVLWPNHLFGGLLQRDGGIGGLERGDGGTAAGITEGLRGIAGRIQDTDALLQSTMSDELRDWDLWYSDWLLKNPSNADTLLGARWFSRYC